MAVEKDNVIYANFGQRKRVSSPEEVKHVQRNGALSPAATRVVDFINSGTDSGRITRGRQYAAGGHVVSLDVRDGAVHGQVAGSQIEPFTVLIQLPFRTKEDIEELSRTFARTPNSMANARNGVLSDHVIDLLFAEKLEDIRFSCTCPDGEYVCKHVVAVADRLAARIDADPAVIFSMRGMSFARLEEMVMTEAHTAAHDSISDDSLKPEQRHQLFWEGRELPDLPRPKVAPALDDSDPDLLRKAMRAVSHTNIDLLRAVSDIEDMYHHLTHK